MRRDGSSENHARLAEMAAVGVAVAAAQHMGSGAGDVRGGKKRCRQ